MLLSGMLLPPATALALSAPSVVQQRKRALLSSVATLKRSPSVAARDAVLAAVADLEACNVTSAPPDGRWALIFSTQAELPDRPGASSPVQGLIDATYAAFFKVAPALAGAQQDGRSGASNEQALSLDTGVVENRVRIPLPFLPSILEIRVDGRVAEAGAAETEPLLDVTFTECSFALQRGGARSSGGALRIPLPSPVGTLRTTHCDDEVRVSRGGRGGVFVLKRLRAAAT